MIHPTCTEVLATVQTAIRNEILPKLSDVDARSSVATIEHLLRHVALRIEEEGAVLWRDIERLEGLLDEAAGWFDSVGAAEGAPVRIVLTQARLERQGYLSVSALGKRALVLRSALTVAQQALQAMRTQHEADARYGALRAAIRDYIAAQIDDESRLIDPAFTGQGPRR